MKKLYTLALAVFFIVSASSQTVNQSELNEFYEKQQTPFLKGNGETFVLDGTYWKRPYGEKEYVLTPVMESIKEYNNRIRKLDEPNNNIYKSIFHFIKVQLNSNTKLLLSEMNIIVPNYINSEVNVYLPQIDIDKLSRENISFSYIKNYGKAPVKISENNKGIEAILFSEGFESSTVPGSIFSTSINGAANCGWKDKSCNPHSGNWSVYCAGTCDANCNSYVNDMDSEFWTTNYINTSGYQDLWLKFWLNFDMYNIGSNDILYIYHNVGNSWVLDFTYNSSHNNDGAGWKYYQSFLSGSFSGFGFDFRFVSNGTGASTGVFVDDIELTGTPSVGIDKINLNDKISVYPNPTNGIFSIEAENMERIEITSITGEIVKELIIDKNIATIDLTSFSSGIYFVKIITDKGSAIKKIVLH